MKLSVAPPALLATALEAPVTKPAADTSLPPSDLDLTRKYSFGKSEVDEAAVLLVEMSILVYWRLDQIREVWKRGHLKRTVAIDPGRRRDDDESWLAVRDLAHTFRSPVSVPLFVNPLGLSLSPETCRVLQLELARRLPPQPGRPLPAPPASAAVPDKEWVRRTRPPRVLAVEWGNSVLIVFRGTSTLSDWGIDLKCWPAAKLPWRHGGFEKVWQSVKPQVEEWLAGVTRSRGSAPRIYLGGHSLGGALATLAAADLSAHYEIARVVTIGSPRVGGRGFRKLYQQCPAAADEHGAKQSLPAVTTRWVHGNDVFATFLPPPLITTHVVPIAYLEAKDRIDIQTYFPANLMDTTSLMNLLLPHKETNVLYSGQPASRTGRLYDFRRMVSQVAFHAAMWAPLASWIRFLLPVLPVLTEDMVRSGFRHKSARYLGFMPPTALLRAMYPPKTAPENSLPQ